MKPIDRRTLLRRLAGAGAFCAAAGRLHEVASAAPAGAVTMRITRYELFRLRVPWAERLREQAVLNWRRENIDNPVSLVSVMKIHTDAGLTGIGIGGGEAALKRMVGRSPWEFVFNDTLGGAQTAVYDLLGKATGLPVCRLLSPNPKKRIFQAFWSLSYPPDLLASEAKMAAQRGYRVHKIKIRPWEDPVAQAQAIFAAVPRDYRVWGDTNHTWGSVGRTLHYTEKLAAFPNYFGLESPVRGREQYRQLKGRLQLRLSEHWGLLDPMETARGALLDAIITASPFFGPAMFRQNAWSEFFKIPLWDESSCWSGIGVAAEAHQAAAYPGIEYTVDATLTAIDDLVKEPFQLRDGLYDIPDKPGLGVTMDDDAVDRYRVR
jgi:L-alanine-DL-glutamate epimerase-like enolase superfamily enzyme